jgi:PKD repeat protein
MTISPGDRGITLPVQRAPVAVGYVKPASGNAAVIRNGIVQRCTAPSPGDHVVIVTLGGGRTVAVRTAGNVPPAAPVPDFTGTPVAGIVPLAVAFTDASAGNPTMWYWSFGDGAHSALRDPQHVYATGGTYTVSLKASNSGGSGTVTKAAYIAVYVPAVFDYNLLAYFTVNGTPVPHLPSWSGSIAALPGGACCTGWMQGATGPELDLAAGFATAGNAACRYMDCVFAFTGTPYAGLGSWAVVTLSGTTVSGGTPAAASAVDPVAGHLRLDLGALCTGVTIAWSGIFANDPAGCIVSLSVSGIVLTV